MKNEKKMKNENPYSVIIQSLCISVFNLTEITMFSAKVSYLTFSWGYCVKKVLLKYI